jgi:UDP-N-acetylglucosamine--N-acetylmuramyl-(pentapeptide) pyrophosphoryl-undecaprenol N-acetylglucosamine transferase
MGSLGSLTITNMMKEIIPSFADKNYEVLFVTGKNYFDSYKDVEVPKNVKLVSNLDDILSVMKKTDLIITRAGASTIAEITSIGVPAIMVPSPYVTHNHQEKNAKVLEDNGSCVLIREKELSKDKLLNTIDELLSDKEKLMSMRRNSKKLGVIDSATKIVEIIEDLVRGDDNE